VVLVLSVIEVAVNVTVAGAGAVAGAVYVIPVPDALPVAEIVPQFAPVQPAPDKLQLTPLLAGSFFTVGVNTLLPPVRITVFDGVIVSVIPAGVAAVSAMVAVALLVPSLIAVAESVAVAGLGTVIGAVYITAAPEALLAGEIVPPPADTVQFTPLLPGSFATAAVNVDVCPVCIVEELGVTVTEIAPAIGVPPPLWLDPPPHPLIHAFTKIAATHKKCAAPRTDTRIKAFSRYEFNSFL
jgi:hypothetical protein